MFDGLLNLSLINVALTQNVPFLGAFDFPESQHLSILNNFSICFCFALPFPFHVPIQCFNTTLLLFFKILLCSLQYLETWFYVIQKVYRKNVSQFGRYVRKKKLITKINLNSNENIFYILVSRKKKSESKFMQIRLIKRLSFTQVTVVPKK